MYMYIHVYTHMYSDMLYMLYSVHVHCISLACCTVYMYMLCVLYNVHRSTPSLHAHMQWCSLARVGTGRGELGAGWAGSQPGPYRRSLMMETVECFLNHVRREGCMYMHVYIQWNLSNLDNLGTEESVLSY